MSPRLRQTVFYTPSTLTVSEGQDVQGRVTCAPNTRNNRDLDITFEYEVQAESGVAGGATPKTVVHYKMCVFGVKVRVHADLQLGLDAIARFPRHRSFCVVGYIKNA